MNVISVLTTSIVLILFFWLTYNLPAVIIGFKEWTKIKKRRENSLNTEDPPDDPQPRVSIIVPVKNEDKVVERLLKTLVDLSYSNKEIIIVEDGSTDKTPQICQHWADKYPSLIRCYRNGVSNGKPSAINYAAKKATGEIIAVYDADTMLEPDTLQEVVLHFADPKVAAVQGELETLNPDENVITRLSVLNDFIVNIQQIGRDRLNLFVPLLGTNQYIRRNVLEELGYWDSNALSEDTEISLRLARKGYKVKYVHVKAMVEAPAKLKSFVKQRMKWLRGYSQAAMKHIGFVRNPNWKTLDAQLMLLFPLMLIIGLVGYAMAIYGAINFGVVQTYGIPIVQILGTALLLLNLLTSAMVVAASPKNAVYVPLLYLDWILLASVSLYVHIRALLRKPQKWTRTPKSGHITVNVT
ncbi:MAG: glycosyltransferase family 2 protein [Candidatus Bathyarchaeota archaeon]|nr:glycosyltransferase family 2 protein [Candidatus Bathyarchaeota archaeon]